jgi:hypothetical protein
MGEPEFKPEAEKKKIKNGGNSTRTIARTVPPNGQSGRPHVDIDWAAFNTLCAVACTREEIAAYFKCSIPTIERAVLREHGMRYGEYYAQHASHMTAALRRKQIQLALNGNVTMLIWLGKQYLGQSEQQKTEVSGPGGSPIEVNVANVRERVTGRILSIAARLTEGADITEPERGGADGP